MSVYAVSFKFYFFKLEFRQGIRRFPSITMCSLHSFISHPFQIRRQNLQCLMRGLLRKKKEEVEMNTEVNRV